MFIAHLTVFKKTTKRHTSGHACEVFSENITWVWMATSYVLKVQAEKEEKRESQMSASIPLSLLLYL